MNGRIKLELHSLATGKGFSDINAGLQNVAKSSKGTATTLMQAFAGIEKVLGDAGGALSKFGSGLLNMVAQGGVWGAMSVAVNAGCEAIGRWMEEARKAEEFARQKFVDTVNAIADAYKRATKSSDEYIASVKKAAAIDIGEATDAAETKLVKLNIETLQKITDEMGASEKALIRAQAAQEAAHIKAALATEKAAREVDTARKEEAAIAKNTKAARKSFYSAEWEKEKYETANERIIEYYKRGAGKGYDGFDEFVEKNKDVIEKYNQLCEAVEKQKEAVNEAIERETDAHRALEKALRDQEKQTLINQESELRTQKEIETVKFNIAKEAEDAAKKEAEELEQEAKRKREAEERVVKENERLAEATKREAEAAQKAAEKGFAADMGNILKGKQGGLAAAQANMRNAQEMVNAAMRNYRNIDAVKAQMEEEKANAKAERRFRNDFASLTSRRVDWRTATNLSARQRATRDLALAKEAEEAAKVEEKKAQQAVMNIERLVKDIGLKFQV